MKGAKSEMITIRLSPDELAQVIEWGKEMGGLPSKAEAARDMIVWAAKHKGKRK